MSFLKKTHSAPAAEDPHAGMDVDQVMKKYDRESNVRIWEGWQKIALRWLLAVFLVGLLFCLGTYDEAVFAWLTDACQHALRAVGLDTWAGRIQQGTSGQVTTRSLPAMLLYGLGYTSICLGILALLLPPPASRTALGLYALVFVLSALLLLGGKLAGDVAWAYQLGRRLIDFIVSPLPLIVLLPLLGWQYSLAQDRP